MTSDLEDRLRSITGPSLDRPLDAVLARGARIRRRRRASRLLLGAAAAIAVAAVVTYAVTPTRQDGTPAATDPSALVARVPARTVSFSGGPTNLTDAQIRTLSTSCLRSRVREDNASEADIRLGRYFPSDMRANVAERQGDQVRAVFVSPRYILTCIATGARTQSGTRLPLDLSHGFPETLYRIGTHPERGLAGDFYVGLLGDRVGYEMAVPTTVRSVVFTFPHRTFKATMVDGAAVAWPRAHTTIGNSDTADTGLLDRMGFVAYDAEGHVVQRYDGSGSHH